MTLIDTPAPGTFGGPTYDESGGPTSNQLLPKIMPTILSPFIYLAMLTGGTSLPPHAETPPSLSVTYRSGVASRTPLRVEERNAVEDSLPALARSVRSLRQRSGLTWEELARIFGVTRRTLHNWSVGGQLSATHARDLARVIALVHDVDTGNPKTTRSSLLAPRENGTTLFDRLVVRRGNTIIPVSGPEFRPEQLLGARHDTPDPTGDLTDFEPLD